MTAARETLGFVGLGHKGGNMAARFLAAGYAVHCESRSKERAQHLVDTGLRWCDTPREVAAAAEIISTSIPMMLPSKTSPPGPMGSLPGSSPARSGWT